MTLLHFLNCAMLTFVPLFLVDRTTSLTDQKRARIYFTCLYTYFISKAAQMLITAVVLPGATSGTFSPIQSMMVAAVNSTDIAAAMWCLKTAKKYSDDKGRILAVGLGWAATDAVLTRLVPLIAGARAAEFGWGMMQTAVTANIALVQSMSLAALVLVFMSPRHSNTQSLVGLVLLELIPVFTGLAAQAASLDSWSTVAAQAGFTAVVAVVAWQSVAHLL